MWGNLRCHHQVSLQDSAVSALHPHDDSDLAVKRPLSCHWHVHRVDSSRTVRLFLRNSGLVRGDSVFPSCSVLPCDDACGDFRSFQVGLL